MRDSDDERPTISQEGRAGAFGPEDAKTTVNANEHLAPGTDVAGYIIEGDLGTGGMGVVYSAVHPVIGKRVAIKVLRPELSGHPAAVERFMMEARAVNQIGHPNIVDIFAFGALPDGRSYYVMDLLNGESLRRRLKRGGPMHVSEAANVIDEVSSALMAAHDKGIVHRDLKPDNVFMVSVPGRWPEVKILDWGLLKLTSAQSAVMASSKYRTLAGSVMGTPAYMSPEQARASDSVDFRSDIYSLGAMAYELLSGSVPFKKGTPVDTLLAVQDDPVPPLANKCPTLPEEIVQLIEAMLAKNPEHRPTLAAVRTVIKRLKGNKIPTMTAAGLAMPPGPGTPFVEPPTNSHPTYGSPSAPRAPFVEPPTNSHPTIDIKRFPSEPRANSQGGDSAMSLPPPPAPPTTKNPWEEDAATQSKPYDSMSVSNATLAGHTMPSPAQSTRAVTYRSPVPGSIPPMKIPPQGLPQGSIPPQHQPQQPRAPQGSFPPYGQERPSQPQMQYPQMPQRVSQPSIRPGPASRMRRILVIAAAAVIVSTIGILITLMT